MKLRTALAAACTAALPALQAQGIHSVSMGFGANGTSQQALVLDDVVRLTSLDRESLAGHTLTSYDDGRMESFTFGMSIGLLPWRNEDRDGPELRLGFIHAGWNEGFAMLRHEVRTPFDTLVSTVTGAQYPVDSVHGSTYFINTKAERIGVDASLVWSTKGRWRLSGGVGLMGGPTFNANTKVVKEVYEGVADAGNQYSRYNMQVGQVNERTTFKGGTGWWVAAQVPLGLSFTLGKENPFWKQLQLYYEVRPQLLCQGSPELDSTMGTGVLSQFGMRLSL